MKNERKESEVVVDAEVIDVEEYARDGKKVPKGKVYRIKVDKVKYDVEEALLTGREILELAGKEPPERFQLNQKLKGGEVKPIGLNESVDLTAPGVEKFMTVPLDQNEG